MQSKIGRKRRRKINKLYNSYNAATSKPEFDIIKENKKIKKVVELSRKKYLITKLKDDKTSFLKYYSHYLNNQIHIYFAHQEDNDNLFYSRNCSLKLIFITQILKNMGFKFKGMNIEEMIKRHIASLRCRIPALDDRIVRICSKIPNDKYGGPIDNLYLSLGFDKVSILCSICNKPPHDQSCKHIPGTIDLDGNIIPPRIKDITKAQSHISFTPNPEVPGTMILPQFEKIYDINSIATFLKVKKDKITQNKFDVICNYCNDYNVEKQFSNVNQFLKQQGIDPKWLVKTISGKQSIDESIRDTSSFVKYCNKLGMGILLKSSLSNQVFNFRGVIPADAFKDIIVNSDNKE